MADTEKIELVDLAYAAGAIDADGHITVTRSNRTKGKRYTHSPTYYHPRVGFTSTEEIVPNFLKNLFGGSICKHVPKNTNHKPVYNWSVASADCGRVAAKLLPYLKLNKHEAELVINLCAVIVEQHENQKRTQKPPYRITPDQLSVREKVWEQVTVLNQPRNRRVHMAGRLLDGITHTEFPKVGA